MRFINKYKNFHNTNLIIESIPNRIVKFKRPKWKKIQSKKKVFFNFKTNYVNKVSFKKWEKIKTSFKAGLLLKRSLYAFFDNHLNSFYYKKVIRQFKKNFLIKNFIVNGLIKPFYRLDILLWKLNFFKSSYQSNQYILNKNVLLNEIPIKHCIFLKKGDIISLKKSINGNFNKGNKNIFSFAEIDYYTNTIIILKDFDELNFDDFFFFFNKTLNFKKLIDYIKSK